MQWMTVNYWRGDKTTSCTNEESNFETENNKYISHDHDHDHDHLKTKNIDFKAKTVSATGQQFDLTKASADRSNQTNKFESVSRGIKAYIIHTELNVIFSETKEIFSGFLMFEKYFKGLKFVNALRKRVMGTRVEKVEFSFTKGLREISYRQYWFTIVLLRILFYFSFIFRVLTLETCQQLKKEQDDQIPGMKSFSARQFQFVIFRDFSSPLGFF